MTAAPARKQQVDTRDPIEVLKREKLITVRDIASAFSTMGRPWTSRQARRWMQRSGIGFQLEPAPKGQRGRGQHGGPWYTTRPKLRESFPDVMNMIEQENLEKSEREWGDD